MSVGLATNPMATPKKKMGRPRKGRNDVSVKVDSKIVSRARLIVADSGLSMAEYFSDILAPVVERDFKRLTTKLADSE